MRVGWQVITSVFMKIKMMLVQWPHGPSPGRFYLNRRSSSTKAGPGSYSLSVTKRKKALQCWKKVGKMLKDLLDLGIDLVCFGVDTSSQDSKMIGEGKTTSFMKEMPDLLSKLYSFYEFESCTQEKDYRDVKELHKLCQEHMNKLYNQAMGKQGPFPYKVVANGSIIVTGLPANVLPVKSLSNYGEQKLSSSLCFVQNQLFSFEMEILTVKKESHNSL